MRDFHDTHVSEMMLDITGERRSVPQMGLGSPQAAADGVSGAAACQVHAGDGNGAGGAPTRFSAHDRTLDLRFYDDLPVDRRAVAIALDDVEVWGAYATQGVGSIYDACVALARLDPSIPIAGTEAWAEGDQTYARRLGAGVWVDWLAGESFGDTLDRIGAVQGLPRDRLAKAEG